MKFTKLLVTSVTLKVGLGVLDAIPNIFFMRGTNHGTIVYMVKLTKLTPVTLKVGQGDPYTIPSSFSMRGTYTLCSMILAHFLFKIILSW
jgi:hypothetical protein